MRLKEIRERNGMTTRELGKQLGVGGTAITNWESGLRRPNIDMLIRLTEIFGCTADELLGINRSPRNDEELVTTDITRSASGQELLGIDRKKPEPEDEAPRTRVSFAEIVQRRTEEARRGAAE